MLAGFCAALAAFWHISPILAQEKSDDSVWIKVCGVDEETDKEICQISQSLLTDGGQLLASLAVQEISGEARKSLLILVPTGMLIQPGIRTQIDDRAADEAKYSICLPNACFSEMVIDQEFIAAMKRGGKIVITTLNQQGQPVTFAMTLIGFTKAYDDPPMAQDELARKQRELEDQLRERAEAARQKLIERQNEVVESDN